MRYAIVESKKVTNVIEWDGKSDISFVRGAPIKVPDNQSVYIGCTYDGTSFTCPKPPQPTTAAAWEQVRAERDGLLSRSDWTQMPDSPLSTAQKTAWAVYRQALRDITKQADPAAVVWPVEPGKKQSLHRIPDY